MFEAPINWVVEHVSLYVTLEIYGLQFLEPEFVERAVESQLFRPYLTLLTDDLTMT